MCPFNGENLLALFTAYAYAIIQNHFYHRRANHRIKAWSELIASRHESDDPFRFGGRSSDVSYKIIILLLDSLFNWVGSRLRMNGRVIVQAL